MSDAEGSRPGFVFVTGETLGQGFQRMYVAMLDDAVAHLSGEGHPDEVEAVHEARKSLKKARSLVRLVRDGMPQYRHANRLCRDAGRKISGLRDASARIETLDMARERFPEGAVDEALDRIRVELVRRRDQAHATVGGPQMAAALTIAREARTHAEILEVDGIDASTLRSGLARTYDRGLKLFRKVQKGYDTELLHQWRKRAKYHRYHVGFLVNAWPLPLKAREKALHTLTEYLGDDHDLAVLRDSLVAVVSELPELQRDAAAVVEVARGVRAELQTLALADGARCFAEDTIGMASRITSYIETWQAGAL
ncbi:MAG: CHAD domain-containing protein [Alphaproteobacteria bacterium]|nr:CHAD domain-containing protein [Alphaproteobacteria bacterium]